MRVAIHQPDYMPWMGLINKIYSSDVFVFLDDAQYSNQAAHNQNVIKGSNGVVSLSVPVVQHLGDKINEVATRDSIPWKKKHLKTVEMSYKKAPYFQEIYSAMEKLILGDYKSIAGLNEAIIMEWARGFNLKTEFKYSSEMNITSVKEERVIDICCAFGADEYISGNGARAYQEEAHFADRGVKLTYQSYTPLKYPQLWGEFAENMSALDYIMNCGYVLPW